MIPNSLLSQVIVGVVSYVAGILSGYYFHDIFSTKIEKGAGNSMVLTVVTTMWALSMVIELINPEYHTSPMVHGLMGAIVGYFYKPIAKN